MKTTKHNWSKDDYILTFYVTKFGTTGLYLRNDDDISKFISTTKASFIKMKSNFSHLLGIPNHLYQVKNLQVEVFEEYNNMSLLLFRDKVKSIIGQDKIELDHIFKKMGKNPEKMRKVNN